jgi:DNA-binding winged helix-turn-helix (wHTH) protein
MAITRFVGGTTFNAETGEVCRDHSIRRLEPQPALVLSLLIHRAGSLVTHDEIRRAVWGDATHVDFQDSAHYCIRQIRQALGDHAREPRIVTTVPKRGYRLNDQAFLRSDSTQGIPTTRSGALEGLCAPVPTSPFDAWRHRLVIGAVVAGLGIATAVLEKRPNNHHATAVAVLKTVHDFVY